jgi:hypothetical protein
MGRKTEGKRRGESEQAVKVEKTVGCLSLGCVTVRKQLGVDNKHQTNFTNFFRTDRKT